MSPEGATPLLVDEPMKNPLWSAGWLFDAVMDVPRSQAPKP